MERYNIPENEAPRDIDVNDREIYTKDDYFSKSPRMRRMIKTKKIKLTAPPNKQSKEENPMILTLGPMLTMGMMSGVTLLTTILSIQRGETTLEKSWTQLITGGSMLLATVLWPTLTQFYGRYD